MTNDESCGEEQNHDGHTWQLNVYEVGIVTLNCPGVDNWHQ